MHELLSRSSKHVVGIRIKGQPDEDMHNSLIALLERVIDEEGYIHLLVELDDFHGWSLKASIQDFKFIAKHKDSIRRVAVVGDSTFLKWCIALDSGLAKMFGIEERYFDVEKMDEAWAFVEK